MLILGLGIGTSSSLGICCTRHNENNSPVTKREVIVITDVRLGTVGATRSYAIPSQKLKIERFTSAAAFRAGGEARGTQTR